MGTIRCILAVWVVVVHSGPVLGVIGPGSVWNIGLNGDQAVTCFFIISGFLIGLILEERYENIMVFYRTRFARIYAPYFVALGLTLVVLIIGYDHRYNVLGFASGAFGSLNFEAMLFFIISNLTIFGTEMAVYFASSMTDFSDFFLVPTNTGVKGEYSYLHGLLIPQAWTLSFELQFYLLAPFLAMLKRSFIAFFAIVLYFAQRQCFIS